MESNKSRGQRESLDGLVSTLKRGGKKAGDRYELWRNTIERRSFIFLFLFHINVTTARILGMYHRADWTLIDVARLDSQFSRGEKPLFFTGEYVHSLINVKRFLYFGTGYRRVISRERGSSIRSDST